ncbi:GrpE nucleotide exchange factor [Gorgonomyces haynaldii]|nr:GrpE nucleotide exchange factor [Gorgonomyces haynaldii]
MSTEGEAKELTEVEQLQLTIKERDTQIAQLQDVYRRALADQENMRQRTQRELVDKEQFAIQKFAKQLLDTADVLSMALDAVPETKREENQDLKNLWVGVDLTRKELLKTFKHFGVEPYDPMGEKFDPNMHTALFQAPMADKEPGTVFHVTKVGYKIKDRVLRSAQVGVVQG